MYAIGVDIGTGSVKAIAATSSGSILACIQIGLQRYSPQPHWVEQDADEVKNATIQALQQLLIKTAERGAPACISFSAAMHSMLAINTEGQPITKAMLWTDARSIAQSSYLSTSDVAHRLQVETGVPTHPMLPLCKVMWLREHQPDIFKQAYKFISLKEYIFHAFTQEYVVDYSIACASGFFDAQLLQWHQTALSFAGISTHQLSIPVPCNYTGTFSAEIDLDLPASMPFVIGSSDGVLATIGSGATQKGTLSLTIGTSGAVRLLSPNPWLQLFPKLFSYVVSPTQYLVGGAINNGGMAADWFAGWFGDTANAHAIMHDALLLDVTCSRPVCLPYFAGERAPVWDAFAQGVFVGVQMQHTPSHMMRAIVEGICFSLFQCAEPLIKLHEVHTIIASGGFIQNEQWVQLLADIFNTKVLVKDDADASALGAVIMGFEAVDISYSAEDGVIKTYEPNIAVQKIYQQRFGIFKELYAMHQHHFSILKNTPA